MDEHCKRSSRRARWQRSAALAFCCVVLARTFALNSDPVAVPKLAVFDFELEDGTASAASAGEHPVDASILSDVTGGARKLLAESGKYSLVDTNGAGSEPAKSHTLHNCDGCEASIALQLGAQQSMLGVVNKVNQIAYAVEIQIRDAASGQVVLARRGVFLGGPNEWRSGVSSLINREILAQR